MSSILDALKKLEKGTESPSISKLQASQTRQSLKRHLRPHHQLWPWAVAGLVVFLLAAATLILKGSHEDAATSPPAETPPAAMKRQPKEAAPPRIKKPRPGPPDQALRASAPKPVRPVISPPPSVTVPPSSSAMGKRLPRIPGSSAPLKHDTAAIPQLPEKPPHMKTTEATPHSPPIKPLPSGSGLVLQALAWAPEPQNRFTVINNQILREGGSIEAMTVMRIEKAQIVLEKNGEQWALRYQN